MKFYSQEGVALPLIYPCLFCIFFVGDRDLGTNKEFVPFVIVFSTNFLVRGYKRQQLLASLKIGTHRI